MLRHLHGYEDETNELFNRYFNFYQLIGCRHNPSCLTPSRNQNETIAYYRDYSEPKETRLYFRGFSLEQLRKYVATYSSQSDCDICTGSSIRRLVRCSRF